MAPLGQTLIGYLPLLIFAAIMLWRLRTIQRARPLRLRTLWILPALLLLVIGFIFVSLPPRPIGIACFALGIVLGAAVGWQRARLMRLHIEGEGESARVMMRQSPAALLLIMAIAAVRGLLRAASGGGVVQAGHLPAAALTLTDALLGFALGMVVAHRVELWRQARALTSISAGQVSEG